MIISIFTHSPAICMGIAASTTVTIAIDSTAIVTVVDAARFMQTAEERSTSCFTYSSSMIFCAELQWSHTREYHTEA